VSVNAGAVVPDFNLGTSRTPPQSVRNSRP
jgi:hypothetical protein